MPSAAKLTYFLRMSHQRDGLAPAKQAYCTDALTLGEWMRYLRALPDTGDMMKKPGDAALLTVELIFPLGVWYFSFYDGHLKTTDTSFYSEPPLPAKQLYQALWTALG